MPKRQLVARAALLFTLLAGCTQRQMPESDVPESESVVVRVENDNISMVRVFVTAGSLQQWIGTVQGEQVGQFTVPGALLRGPTQVSFTAEAMRTGGKYTTPNFVVKPGDIVRLEVGGFPQLLELDRAVVLTCQKSQFSLPDGVHYINCAYMGPLPIRVQEVGLSAVVKKGNPTGFAPDDFFRESDDLRRLFARLINAPDPQRVAIIPAASYGIATAAANAPRKSGDNIVISGEQFPSNVYSWRSLAAQGGELRAVAPPSGPGRGAAWNERILDAIDVNTSVVALPHVHWTDGTRFDLERIGERAREVGAFFVIDGTQSVGALPFDVQLIRPDALVCAGYKWLLGPYSVGCAWYGPAFDNGTPLEQNWVTRLGSENFAGLVDYGDEFQPGALRYDVGERSNFILVPMLVAALEMILDWTPAGIQQYCADLTRDLLAEAPDLGFTIEEESWRGAHLFGLRAPEGRDMDRVHRMLQEAGVYASRRGSALRLAPNIYNNEQDIAALRQVLRDAI